VTAGGLLVQRDGGVEIIDENTGHDAGDVGHAHGNSDDARGMPPAVR
jgi:hypothetical protein